MKSFFEMKRDVEGLFDQSMELMQKIEFQTSNENLVELKQAFAKKELMVVTIGEMRRGKSSMLNAILNEIEPLFPVDINVCTNAVTIVRYGQEERIDVMLDQRNSNGMVETVTRQIARSEIADYVSELGNPSNYRNVRVLEIKIPNDLLKEGVVFVDTPGVGSMNISHAETTYAFLPNADLILFVSDVTAGLSETELNFLAEGYKYCKSILFPVTKIDTNADYSVIVQDNKAKISRIMGTPLDEVQVIPISSYAKLRYLKSKRESMLINSNFPEFERIMWETVAKSQVEVLLLPYLNGLREELEKVAKQVAIQYQLLQSDQGKSNEIYEVYQSKAQQYHALMEQNGGWKDQISINFQKIDLQIPELLSQIRGKAITILDNSIQQYGPKICKQENYEKVYSDINSSFTISMMELKAELQERTGTIVEAISVDLGIDIDTDQEALEELHLELNETSQNLFPVKQKVKNAVQKGKKVFQKSGKAGKVGMIVGGVVLVGLTVLAGPAVVAAEAGLSVATTVATTAAGGLVIGNYVGRAIGGAKGCIDEIRKGREVNTNHVRTAYMKHIEESTKQIHAIIIQALSKIKNDILNDFAIRLERKVLELKENMRQIGDNSKYAKQDIDKQMEKQETRAKLLNEQLERVEALWNELSNE